MADQRPSGSSRRIGSRGAAQTSLASASLQKVPKAILLGVLTGVMALIALIVLASGEFTRAFGSCAACAGMLLASRMMANGLRQQADFEARRIAQAPKPLKTLAHLLIGGSIFVVAWLTAQEPLALALLYGGLAGVGSYLAYGADPRHNKEIDSRLAERAGIDTAQIVDALNEAETKLAAIEVDAREILNRELVQRLGRIVASGRRILKQIERDPSDIRRARRFLITYLDGTHEIVSKYRDQQHDIAETELGDNFRHVLDTVEKVFGEQETVLKRNETLDLEVQIEVLQTQMEREGVV